MNVKRVIKEFLFVGPGDAMESVHIGVFPSRGRYFRSRMRRRDACVFVAELEVPAGDLFYHFFVNGNFEEPLVGFQEHPMMTTDPLKRCHVNLSTEPFGPVRFNGDFALCHSEGGDIRLGAVSFQRWVEMVSMITAEGHGIPFGLSYTFRNKKYWKCDFSGDCPGGKYVLKLSGGDIDAYYSKNGLSPSLPPQSWFFDTADLAKFQDSPVISSGAVGYQVFPDRFHRLEHDLSGPGNSTWGEAPGHYTLAGGTLRGIQEKLDYLVELGVDFLYLNPVFHAQSNHRYDATDYYLVDPMLGSNRDFGNLVEEAHARGIAVILDLAFNHCGTDFFAFADVLRFQRGSRYRDWFHIHEFPVEIRENPPYDGWHGYKHLPEFNLENSCVREYLLAVARFWVQEFDVDGYRLDVCSALPTDFIRDVSAAVRAVKSGAVIIGEYWHGNGGDLVVNGEVNGVTNYSFYWNVIIPLFCQNSVQLQHVADRMMMIFHNDPPGAVYSYWNFLSNHDLPRMVSVMKDRRMLKLALALLYIFPGIPVIYYGEEIALEGLGDPDNRRCMNWGASDRSIDLLDFYKELNCLRREYRHIFAFGDFSIPFVDEVGRRMMVMRKLGKKRLIALLNFSEESWNVEYEMLPGTTAWWDSQYRKPVSGSLWIEGYAPVILLGREEGQLYE